MQVARQDIGQLTDLAPAGGRREDYLLVRRAAAAAKERREDGSDQRCDRGRIGPGLRADLLPVDGDPLADIRATRAIRRIWIGGSEREPAAG